MNAHWATGQQERLRALRALDILDTPPEPVFDRIAARAAQVFGAPMGALALIDENRVWYKARYGLFVAEVPLEHSFPGPEILRTAVVAVPDVLEEPEFAANPLVTGPEQARFYCGAAVQSREGLVLGTVEAMDTEPRVSVSPEQKAALEALARLAADELEFRRALATVERARAEKAQRDADALLASALSAGAPAAILSGEDSIEYANEAFCRLTGLDAGKIAGQALPVAEAVLPVLETPHELQLLASDGRIVPVLATASPIPGPVAGRKVVTFTDLRERNAREEFARQVEKMDAVKRLAGSTAHTLNNVLAIITGFAQMVRDSVVAEDPIASYADEIAAAADRASTITGKLLLFGGRRIGTPAMVNVNEVVTGLESAICGDVGERIAVSTELAPEPGKFRADRGHVGQVVLNLVANAKEAMPEGGALTLRTANVELSEEYVRTHPGVHPGRYVLLEVRDTGTGMTPEVRARAFEPFYSTRGAGRGAGLATVYGIVTQARGHIDMESEPGAGTTVRVYFPATP